MLNISHYVMFTAHNISGFVSPSGTTTFGCTACFIYIYFAVNAIYEYSRAILVISSSVSPLNYGISFRDDERDSFIFTSRSETKYARSPTATVLFRE